MAARGTSPFPHLSDQVWNDARTSPYAEYPKSEPFPDELVPRLCCVTDDDRGRAPRGPVPSALPVPEPGDIPAIRARFRVDLRAGGFLEHPCWPVCCQRPSTLLAAETPFDRVEGLMLSSGQIPHFTETEIREGWGMTEDQVARALAQLDDPRAPEPFAKPQGVRGLLGRWRPFLEGYAEQQTQARDGLDGTAVFQCRACGRYYLGSHHIP